MKINKFKASQLVLKAFLKGRLTDSKFDDLVVVGGLLNKSHEEIIDTFDKNLVGKSISINKLNRILSGVCTVSDSSNLTKAITDSKVSFDDVLFKLNDSLDKVNKCELIRLLIKK